MYNFFNYFFGVYLLVFGFIIGWFIFQLRIEKRYIKKNNLMIKEKK